VENGVLMGSLIPRSYTRHIELIPKVQRTPN
jgi:hypothetical protein